MTTGTSDDTLKTFLLPDLGEGLTEAEVVHWLVAEGDEVAVDQSVVEVETAKSLVEVPSPFAGQVATLHAAEGDTVAVGEPLISISVADSSGAAQDATATPREEEAYREEEQAGSGNVLIGYGTSDGGASGRRRRPRRPAAADTAAGSAATVEPQRTHRVTLVTSPLVRRLARDHDVDLGAIAGTGAGGVVTRADVTRAIEAQTTTPSPDPTPESSPAAAGGERRLPLTGFRKAVSEALSRSRTEIPEATVWVDVDATNLWELRESGRATAGPGLLAYLARFTVAALREYPVLNARLDTEGQEIVELEEINLGVAVQGDRGLMAPAVMGAHTMTTAGLDDELRTLTARAREGRCTPEELTAGTFTLNNYGSFRVDGSAAIINHPQVAILGFGRILDRPWVVDGEITVRKITQMSFAFDHRVCDGGTAAGFMRSVADAIENPASAIGRL